MHVTLRIKKFYFDAIKRREKTYELREDTEYYRRRFEGKKIDCVMFHYQAGERLYVDVSKVELIDTPKESKLMKTPKCWRISLKRTMVYERRSY